MKKPRFSEDIRPITDFKTRAAEILDHVRKSRRPVLLTRRGRGVAVLLDLEDYETLTDRAAFVEAVQLGVRAERDGDLHPHENAERLLDRFGGAERVK